MHHQQKEYSSESILNVHHHHHRQSTINVQNAHRAKHQTIQRQWSTTKRYFSILIFCIYIFLTNVNCLPIEEQYDDDDLQYFVDKNMTCDTNECWHISEKLSTSIDNEINPCNDFYQFVCGRWIMEHPVPKYLNSWNQFQLFALLIRNNMKRRLESDFQMVNDNQNLTKNYGKLFEFYRACTNTTQRNLVGYDELYKIIEQIGGWPMLDGKTWNETSFNWEKAYVTLALLNIDYFINLDAIIDFKNTSKIILQLGPPYLNSENIINLRQQSKQIKSKPNDDDIMEENKQIYMKVLKELRDHYPHNHNLSLNDTELRKDIDDLFDLQIQLENQTGPILPMSYFQTHYEEHLVNISTIKEKLKFNITYLLDKIFNEKFEDSELIFVPDFDYLNNLSPLLNKTPKRVLANYFAANMAYQMVRHTTTKMMKLFEEDLEETDVVQNLCYSETATFLPELLGKLYLDSYFNYKTRQDLQKMSNLLRDSFLELIKESQWMDNETINEAINKLDWMSMNIAYPDWYENDEILKSYSDLYSGINSTNFIQSIFFVSRMRAIISHDLLNEMNLFPKNGTHPVMLNWPRRQITDINAFYYFTTNGVYMPAGILQEDIYSVNIPGEITFGSVGMILGHEMTHAFDISGRLYDEHGALRNWWTDQTKTLFVEKARCFMDQYSNYSIKTDKIDGRQTLAENIADNGGLRQAYKAFKTHRERYPNEKWRLPGAMSKYTSDQLFFISFAHMWCANMEDAAIREIIMFNSHSPPSIRVRGSLANFEPFAQAFNCSINSPMNPERKCVLW